MNPRRSNSSLPTPGRSAYGAATAATLLLIPVIVLVGGDGLRDFLNFGAGVLSLVALSCSVIWGLVATDRLFLNTRQRIVAQAVHRTTAISSVAFLLLHVTVKLALDHTQLIAALIPFSLGVTGSAGLIGFGSVAGLLMIFTAITGALRNAFATSYPVAARWRAMHMLAYPAWCCALVHGLYAGRQAKPIFVIMYSLCLVGVMGALALRAAPRPFKRKVADRIVAIIGNGAPLGREELEASRARNAESRAGSGGRGAGGRSGGSGSRDPEESILAASQRMAASSASPYDAPPASRSMTPEPSNGFAAAYRATSATPRAQDPFGADGTQRMDLPMDMQATAAMPRVDDGASNAPRWPSPSPPPVGEAPRSSFDPMNDTYAGGISYQGYDNSYAQGESNVPYGTYNTNDTYNSGPATETLPGAYDAPGSGEPWNAPSGGF
ncbi:cytochrome b/b6 domain-containing protein [Streptomyces avermitilis]|uniref:cytochrome b/b6 domain-containing protein n=1 Tax=Streptomyces avermitilis TaxID=33903 RepID=UPI003407339A